MSVTPHILLANKDREACAVFEGFCKRNGWHFSIVNDGDTLLQAVSENKYDAVVTNYKLSKLSGAKLLRSLKKHCPPTSIIVIGDDNSVDEAMCALREGVSDYILKPLDLSALQDALDRVLKVKKMESEDSERFNFVRSQLTTYCFTSREFSDAKIKLGVVDSLYKARCISLDQKLCIELAFQEAVANSLEHGNLELDSVLKEQFDSDGKDYFSKLKAERLKDPKYGERKIFIAIKYRRDWLTISIRDEGRGFCFKNIGKKNLDTADIVTYGRGMAILYSVMDKVLYRDGGRQITMLKKL
ncbi:MAG: response regulator [Bdellovibrionota bacterium]|jgi:FixJ family two-component response regulator